MPAGGSGGGKAPASAPLGVFLRLAVGGGHGAPSSSGSFFLIRGNRTPPCALETLVASWDLLRWLQGPRGPPKDAHAHAQSPPPLALDEGPSDIASLAPGLLCARRSCCCDASSEEPRGRLTLAHFRSAAASGRGASTHVSPPCVHGL